MTLYQYDVHLVKMISIRSFQNLVILILYILVSEIVSTNSRTSTLWKLNPDRTKIIEGGSFYKVVSYQEDLNGVQFITEDDPVFNIITSTVHLGRSWVKERVEYYCTNCHNLKTVKVNKYSNSSNIIDNVVTQAEADEVLDCGKPVNFTYYDNLIGILNRNKHPNVPEPQVALIFTKKSKRKNLQDFDVDALERKLKKAKREKPKSVQLYNQIGNFWRIKGDAEKAIECFRRALAVSPYNAEVLLNLARVLFTLQYLDDAIYLTRRSLEVQPPDKGAWQQYFTLGEILKAYGHYQEATIHLKHTLELKPGFEPAQIALKEMENVPTATLHIYTLVIIICLVLGCLLVILSSVDNISDTEYTEVKIPKHFHKSATTRALRSFGLSQKHTRPKRILA